MTVKVIIGQEGEKYRNWGYEVNSPLDVSNQYGVRAYLLEGHFLLEERRGSKSSSSSRWVPFGIVDGNRQKEADRRILEKVRDSAKRTLEDLTPELVEQISEEPIEVELPAQTDYSQLDPETRRKYEMPISRLDLIIRASNCLEFAKIETVGQLVEKTEGELLRLRSFGRTSLRNVKGKLEDIGLSLRA